MVTMKQTRSYNFSDAYTKNTLYLQNIEFYDLSTNIICMCHTDSRFGRNSLNYSENCIKINFIV